MRVAAWKGLMKKVTKEWMWLGSALTGSLVFVASLISAGVQPHQSLPEAIYVIWMPIALVYLIRLLLWATGLLYRKLRPSSNIPRR